MNQSAISPEQDIREAIGVFFVPECVSEAITELRSSGFRAEQIGMLANEGAVREQLGEVYEEVNRTADCDAAPEMAFVRKEHDAEAAHAFTKGFYFVGSTGTLGAVVASAGFLGGGPAVLVALAASGGVLGALGLRAIIKETDAEHLLSQLNQGHLLLFVRAEGSQAERQAKEIMGRHGATDVRIYEVPQEDNEDH